MTVAKAVEAMWPGDVIVGVSGGADSMALALGAQWCARRRGGSVKAVVVDHQLQEGSGAVAVDVQGTLTARGINTEVCVVNVVAQGEGLEAAARDARLEALASYGLPVLLGHNANDQAEQVLLGLIRGSGTRSLAGIAAEREQFIRPLLDVPRAVIEEACVEWGIEAWSDPMNDDDAFMRVRVRAWLVSLEEAGERGLVSALGRTARLARADADLLDAAADKLVPEGSELPLAALNQPDALRWRILKIWMERQGIVPEMVHVLAVDQLVREWRGQGPIHVPGGKVFRHDRALRLLV